MLPDLQRAEFAGYADIDALLRAYSSKKVHRERVAPLDKLGLAAWLVNGSDTRVVIRLSVDSDARRDVRT